MKKSKNKSIRIFLTPLLCRQLGVEISTEWVHYVEVHDKDGVKQYFNGELQVTGRPTERG